MTKTICALFIKMYSSLAAEIDLNGATDVFGVSAYFVGRPTKLLLDSGSPIKITATPPKLNNQPEDSARSRRKVIESLATELFGARASIN